MPAAIAAALPPEDPPGTRAGIAGVEGGAERGVLGGGPHAELVHVGLARQSPLPIF